MTAARPVRTGSRLSPGQWAGVLATVAACGILGAAVGMLPLALAVLLAAVALAGAATAGRGTDAITLVVVGLVYSNAAVVAFREHGVPFVVAVAVPALLLVPLLHHVLLRRQPLRLGAAGPWLIALVVVHFVSALFSDDAAGGLDAVVSFGAYGLGLYLVVLNVLRTPRLVRTAALVVVGVAGASGTLSAVQMVTGAYHRGFFGFAGVLQGDLLEAPDWRTWEGLEAPVSQLRAVGPIGEPNFYAYILVAALPFAVAFALAPQRRLERTVGLLATPALLAGIVATYSRGAAVVLVATVALLAIAGILPRRTLAFGAIAGVALLLLVPSYGQRLVGLAAAPRVLVGAEAPDAEPDAAILGRYSEMVVAGRAFVEHPVLGLGPGQFPGAYQSYARPLGFFVHEGEREPHNLYLHFAAELGALGVIALVGVLAALAYRLLAVLRRSRTSAARAFTMACLGAVTAIAVNGMFLHLAYLRYLSLLLALTAAWAAVAGTDGDRGDRAGVPAEAETRPDAALRGAG